MNFNNIKNKNKIKNRQQLIIPVIPNQYQKYYSKTITEQAQTTQKVMPPDASDRRKISYGVKKGDTLGEIAEAYYIRAQDIRRWNGLRYRDYIYPGQKLDIWAKEQSLTKNSSGSENPDQNKSKYTEIASNTKMHVVKRGQNLWNIAKMYGVKVTSLMLLNNKNRSLIHPGDRLLIPVN